MRYLVSARVRPGKERELLRAIEQGSLGRGSVAGDEYLAHHRDRCRDASGSEPWACCACDCSARLERHLAATGRPFLELLREVVAGHTESGGSR